MKRPFFVFLQILLLSGLPFLAGCDKSSKSKGRRKESPIRVKFTDVTKEAGIRFVHNSEAFGARWLPETMGTG